MSHRESPKRWQKGTSDVTSGSQWFSFLKLCIKLDNVTLSVLWGPEKRQRVTHFKRKFLQENHQTYYWSYHPLYYFIIKKLQGLGTPTSTLNQIKLKKTWWEIKKDTKYSPLINRWMSILMKMLIDSKNNIKFKINNHPKPAPCSYNRLLIKIQGKGHFFLTTLKAKKKK